MKNEFERKDIVLETKLPWIVYGDGYMAQINNIVASTDDNGEETLKLTITPTPELAKRYNINIDMIDEHLYINVEYPKNMIKQINNDPAWTVYFCFLNFFGQPTSSTNFWNGMIDIERVNGLSKINHLLKAENAYLVEQLEKAKTNVSQYIKEFIQGPANEMNAQLLAQQMQGTQNPVRNI
jgi:hypothetical protein